MKRFILTYKNKRGFTLLELIVVMAVFLVVMAIAMQSFNNIFSLSSKITKSEESNIEGIIGLELMRHDLETMGFGLFWGFLPGSTVNYSESTVADADTNDYDKTGRADSAEDKVPRAVVGQDGRAYNSSDLIVVKGSNLGMTQTSHRWSYIPFHNYSANPWESRPVTWPSDNLKTTDQVIAIRTNFNDPTDDHLLLDKSGTYGFSYKTSGIDNAYLPQCDQETHLIYGIDQGTLRMPFNRSDFFVKSPAVSTTCAPNTGMLYKGVVNHTDGGYTEIGLLDCVADMQVVLGWDSSNGGLANNVDTYSSLLSTSGTIYVSGSVGASTVQAWLNSPKSIREHLKIVKVYILAQEGKRDRNTVSPASYIVGGDGETSLTRTYNLSSDQRRYRWKLYQIVTRPKNLISNQK